MNFPTSILIIEDNNEIRENLEELLSLSGYNTITASNGEIGLIKATQEKPGIIICDIAMPMKNGYEVFQALKPQLEKDKTPFVFLTASAQEKDIAEGKTLGVDAYLTKPFQEEDLLEVIRDLLNR